MPATTRKPPTASANSPPKKRQRQLVHPSLSSPSAQPPPSTTSSVASPAPPLSAVAARRAAAAAAASSSTPSTRAPSPVQLELDHSRTVVEAQDSDGSDSDSASDVEAALLAREQSTRTRNAKGKGKAVEKKQKKEAASRYFSGPQEEDVVRFEAEEEDSRMQSEEVREVSTPKAARPRRRREKTAFVDPECYSNFRLEENSNAWSTNVSREGESSCEGVIYGLRIGEDLVVHGTFDLTLLSGSISLLGSTLSSLSAPSDVTIPTIQSSNTHRVYSPASHPIPPISALPDDPNVPKSSSLSLYLNTQIDISRFAAVVLITSVQTGIEGIEASLKSGGLGCANALFPWPSNAIGSFSSGRSWKLVMEPVPGLTILRQLEPWSTALSSLVSNAAIDQAPVDPGRLSVLVEGPKRVGKSTFAKMLLNRLLDRYEAVAYLDTDLGQPEFSTPGFVSLNVLRKPVFGPAFTHLTLPISSHYLGSTSPASDPTSYMTAISSLLATYALEVEYPLIDEPIPSNPRRRHHRAQAAQQTSPSSSSRGGGAGGDKVRERVPLVINTQGWVKGLGADLLSKLKAESQPTHVCSFVSPIDEDSGAYSDGGVGTSSYPHQQYNNVEEGLPYHLFTLPAAPPNPLESKWTASDYRTLSLVSYFHSGLAASPSPSITPTSILPSTWDFSAPIVSQVPYSLDWQREASQISSVHLFDGDDISYKHVLHALNGSLVAIVADPSVLSTETFSAETSSSFPYNPASPLPSPSTSRALGLGLVRSILPSSTSIHLLTPIPPPSSSVSFVKGSLEVPLALLLDHTANESERELGLKGFEWKHVPFLSIEEGEGAGRRRVRRNLMRRGHA